MRLAVLADVHGDPERLAAVLQHLRGRVDRHLFLGDFCGYGSDVSSCLALWPEPEIVGVRGNHDQALLDLVDRKAFGEYPQAFVPVLERTRARLTAADIARLRALPRARILPVGNLSIAMYHGAPWDALNARVYPDFEHWDRFGSVEADLILLAHTHHAFHRRFGDKVIVNPGSVGQPRDGEGSSYAVLHLPQRRVDLERIPYAGGAG